MNNIHHIILKCILLVVYIFLDQYCHCDHIALHVTGSSDVGSCNNRF